MQVVVVRRHVVVCVFSSYVGNADCFDGGAVPISVYLGLLDMSFLECSGVIGALRHVGEQGDVATVLLRVHQYFVGGTGGIIWYIGAIGA